MRWQAKDAAVDARGRLVAGERDAVVTAYAGGATTSLTIPVGRHTVPLALFDDAHRGAWRLVTAPADGPGAVGVEAGTLRLDYDFGSGERAAYALANAPLPLGAALALSCEVTGDANGAALRASLADRYGDRDTITFARAIDFSGVRKLSAKIPAALAPPLALRSFYAVGTLANPPVTAAGTLAIAQLHGDRPRQRTRRDASAGVRYDAEAGDSLSAAARRARRPSAAQPQPSTNSAMPAPSAQAGGAAAIASAG